MCYAKPGPRCSAHAKKALEKALMKYQQAKNDYDELCKNSSAQDQIDEANKRKYRIEEQIHILRSIYNTTPAGLKDLESRLETAKKQSDKRMIRNAEDELISAKSIRKRQMLLYKAKTGEHGVYKTSIGNYGDIVEALKLEGEANKVYPGRLSDKKDEHTREYELLIQSRIDNLIEYYKNDSGRVVITEDISVMYDKMGLTPGYKYLASGAWQSAYLDLKTGKVIKIPRNYQTMRYPDDIYSEIQQREWKAREYENSQESYAIVDIEELNSYNAEYAKTLFFQDTKYDIPTIVQDYLSPDDYIDVEQLDEGQKNRYRVQGRALEVLEGLDDIHIGNFRINKKTGKIVLFDCLDMFR